MACDFDFEPRNGIIEPKSIIPIKFEFTPKTGGLFDEIFICECEGLQFPLGGIFFYAFITFFFFFYIFFFFLSLVVKYKFF